MYEELLAILTKTLDGDLINEHELLTSVLDTEQRMYEELLAILTKTLDGDLINEHELLTPVLDTEQRMYEEIISHFEERETDKQMTHSHVK
ncbi:hypothetical protein PoB_001575600 [Plakobranchus ocellatus]|uniref:Uncharacterized protein n=1 Tax=Plakobranchus ocellatus TaxID=259542 RepID=A0AAV3Z0A3_9GAST|nr:hypothetical protein PoB_001575600 [Plakobranchus ocellatus]